MFQHRELGLIQAYQIGAALIMTALFWVYFFIMKEFSPHFAWGDYFEVYLAIILAFQISFIRTRQNDIFSVASGIVESHHFISPHIIFTVTITGMLMAFMRESPVSRLFLFTYLFLAYGVLVVFTRFFALDLLRYFVGNQSHKLLLVGHPSELAGVSSLLSKAKLFGFETVGMATEALQNELPQGIRKLGNPDDLEAILDSEEIGNIFIIGSPRDRRMLGGWLRLAEARGCRVSLVNDLDLFLQRRLSYFRCDNIDLIELRQEPLQNLVNRTLKRSFDIFASLIVICFFLPPMTLLVWILQQIQAPGPIFFKQIRSGIDNHRFTIYKFRTMYAQQCESALQATAQDDRIYPAGRWLRRFSLDEFPQFLNVLLGHMSLVGPRPHMLQHDELFALKMSNYRIRSFVKPGLTGLAQIRGFRGETATPEAIISRVECDIEYVESWSFFLDLRIMWRTVIHLIRPPKSAY